MHIFMWLDHRTLLASQFPLAAVFAIVLFGIWRVYPHLRGTDTMALGYCLWVPSALLLAAQGSIPSFVSIIGANLLAICGYILVYRGIISFLQAKGAMPIVYDVAAIAAAIVIYFTAISDVALPRIVAMAGFAAVVRALMAVEIFRNAKSRWPLTCFAAFLSIFAVLSLGIAVVALWPGILAPGAPAANTMLLTLGGVVDLLFLAGSGIFAFITFLGEINETVQHQGQLDFVTGTLNRRAIEDTLTVEIARSSRTHSPISVLMIEIDHFKAINDTYGRAKGDQALCTVVTTIASILRFYDKCGRLADDRFMVLLPENSGEHAMVIASRFRAALKQPSLPHDQPAITLSIGVTQCTFKEPTSEVLARADLALCEARNNGRDGACLKFEHEQELKMPAPVNLDRMRTSSRIAKLIR